MKIILKPDWDIPAQIPNKEDTKIKGHFVGRETELSIFVNELLRREQGAILITGHRGVGKTSFVYKALNKVLEHSKVNTTLFVFINGNHLESKTDDDKSKLNSKSILINLITRLYAVSKEDDFISQLDTGIEDLYKKAVASDFKLLEAIERSQQITKETETSIQTDFSAQQISATQITWLISFIAALILQVYPLFPTLEWLNKILPLLLAFPIPFLVSFLWQYKRSAKTSEASRGSAQQLYTMDNSINNLEFDLEQVHRNLNDKGIKTIYILDELDKIETKLVSEIMQYYKNLFTLSSAMFVFIGEEELHHYKGKKDVSTSSETFVPYRPFEYTYFTSKYFLSRPAENDLLIFLDEIIDHVVGAKTEKKLQDFKRSLIFDARCDYFDLLQVVKGKISGFDGLKPILDATLDDETILKSKLQQSLSLVFNEKYITSHLAKWLENEVILRKLYDDAFTLTRISIGASVHDSEFDGYKEYYSMPIQELAVNDFHAFLHRLGFLDLSDYTREISAIGQQDNKKVINSNKYYLTRIFSENIPNQINFLSQPEEQLLNQIEKLYQIVMNCWNIHATLKKIPTITMAKFKLAPLTYAHKINDWGIKTKNTIAELEPVYQKLAESYPARSIKRDDIETHFKRVIELINRLLENAPELLANIYKDSYQDRNYQIIELSQNANLFGSDGNTFRQNMLEMSIPNKIITDQSFQQQLLFCKKLDPKILKSISHISNPDYFGKRGIIIIDKDQANFATSAHFEKKIVAFSLDGNSEEIQEKIKFVLH